jgi:hypothetical protein
VSRWFTGRRRWTVLIGYSLCWTPLAAGDAPLQSLDRLSGFERACGGAPIAFPSKLSKAQTSGDLEIQDFEIPVGGLTLRQALSREHPRITRQWWGVYENSRLAGCWSFSPAGNQEQKRLAPYELDRIVAVNDASIVLRTHGAMHRPGGSGWMQAYDFVFAASGARLRLAYVVDRFFFSYRDVPRGSGVSLITERLVQQDGKPRIEIHARDAIPEARLSKCGFQHPLQSELDDREYFALLERVAACLDILPGARTCYRDLGEASFIERGGKPASCVTGK